VLRAWILAGGRSSRFGSDKAVYAVGGEPLVVRIAAVLRAAGVEPGLVAKAPRGLGLPERLESDVGFHPLHGVATALSDGDALVVPCDLADLDVDTVRRLLAAWSAAPGGVYARGQPLFGVFPAALAERARSFALAGRPVRAFVENLVEVDLGVLTNLNRPPSPGA
jgi:molybdopterin-guanine dinucleotide biosynthesis protein A